MQYIIYSDVYFIPQSCHPGHEPCYLHPSHVQVFLLKPGKRNWDCTKHKKSTGCGTQIAPPIFSSIGDAIWVPHPIVKDTFLMNEKYISYRHIKDVLFRNKIKCAA